MRVGVSFKDVTRVEADTFIACFYTDPRPPRDLVGKVDWYLGGFISRMILSGNLHCHDGDKTLIAIQKKLLTPRLLLIGLGESGVLSPDAVARRFATIGKAVQELGLTSVAMEMPSIDSPMSDPFRILKETLDGFKEGERNTRRDCTILILGRTEKDCQMWRRALKDYHVTRPQ